MNETNIRKYAELMKELGLTGLEITEENSKVRLERSVAVQTKENVYSVPDSAPAVQPTTENKEYISVKSPIVGVFYAAPAENICIIEAMKLMNEITAEEDGVISEVCVTNGQVVEYGTELFRIKR